MNKIIITLLIWMTAAQCQAQQSGAVLRMEKTTIDFGAIEYNSVAVDSMKLYNDGTEPLIILSTFTDCGCTVPSYDREPIAPGTYGIIKVRFNARGRSAGSFRKAVRIRSNTTPPTRVFFISGRVKRPATEP